MQSLFLLGKKNETLNFRWIILLLLVIMISPIWLSAQGDPLLRVELETKSDEANYRVIPCKEKGTTIFYKTTIAEGDYKFWIYVHYNIMLQEAWKQDVPLFDNMEYADHVLQGNNLYCFYHDPEKKKAEEYNFQLVRIDLSAGSYELFSGLLPTTSEFVDFKIMGDLVIVGLNVDVDHAGVYTFNTSSREIKSQLEITDKKARFESLHIDKNDSTCQAIFNVHESKSSYYLLIHEFDKMGQEILSLQVNPESGKKFNTGKIATVSDNIKLMFGTYGVLKTPTIDSKDYYVKESAGFYVVNITDPSSLTVRHENFLDLENMTGYLKSREYQLAKKKAEKKNDDDVDKFSVTYDMLIHDIIERDSMFYFVGEAFYEDYHTVTNTYYDYYGRAVPVSYSVFDGYRYFNAFISCYDYQGNKLWDNGMEIFNIVSFDLQKRVNVYFTGPETVMAYNREGKISAKIIEGPKTVDGVEHFPLETTYYNDKVVDDTKSSMEHWYGNYFIAYGFQTIRNNSLMDKNKRTVFYINKVAFQ